MMREIGGVQQRSPALRKRWFQDSFFDLFFTADEAGGLTWFQLCYARDTWRERVLEWRRGRGFLHLKVKQPAFAADRESGVLERDGVLPYMEVMEQFAQSAQGLPPGVAAFVAERVREYARPDRKYRRKGAATPRWLERLRRHTL
jgi:hypothetical protein